MSAVLVEAVARVKRATRARPDATALTSPDGHLSYEQLWSQALALAGHLNKVGVRRGDPVALCLPRSIELVVGALGILAAGGCYVALDPDYPDDRLGFILADSGTQVVVAKANDNRRMERRRNSHPSESPMTTLTQLPALVVLERIPVPVLAIVQDGTLFANNAFAEMVGHAPEDAWRSSSTRFSTRPRPPNRYSPPSMHSRI